ncbi:MAG TPA: ATP-binding protein [Solirubrobacteraceae bacterium]|nr:ATP-binding protein [Solirubrobacteraceae bacterium]
MARGPDTRNPFTPDSGVKPPALTGRDQELQHLRSIITQVSEGGTERHVLITGLRGVGKTVLLNEFEAMCTDAGWYADTKEVGRTTPLIALVTRVARTALLRMDAKKRAGEKVRNALRALKSFEVTFGGVASLKIEVDAATGVADSGILSEDLRDVLVAVGQAAEEAEIGFALILDELQNAAKEEYEALIMALHRAKQKGLPVVFVGGGLPLLPVLTTDAKSYAERMFIVPKIGALSRAAARAALVLPAERQNVKWEEEAVHRVFTLTEGYPFFLQEYGRRVWSLDDDPTIKIGDVEAAQPIVEADLDEEFYENRIGRLTNNERRYVAALAHLGDGPQRVAGVADLLGRTTSSLSPVRDGLMRSAVVYSPRRGFLDFTVPHCARFVRRNYPFDAEISEA